MKLTNDQFKILDRLTVYESVKLKIDKAKISLPNGNVVEWDANILPPFYYGVPIKEGKVIMTREWRLGPDKILTQFTASRCISDNEDENIRELKRELKEEIGLEGGAYKSIVTFPWGFRTSGDVTYFTVENYTISETKRDENEIQMVITLSIKGLYNELLKNHVATSDTLLVAKILEEKFLLSKM